MLRPLIYLSALIGLAGARKSVSGSSMVDIQGCPITFYGKSYSEIYVNFTSDKFALCFDDYYDPDASQDCIIGPAVDKQTAQLSIFARDGTYEEYYQDSVPTIKTDLSCEVQFTDFDSAESDVILANFGTEAVLHFFKNSDGQAAFETMVGGTTVDTFTFSSSNGNIEDSVDLSGCRHNGAVLKPGTVSDDPTTCTTTTCNENAVIETNQCDWMEECDGAGLCTYDSTCTVTGPSVVDFQDSYNSVNDRCAYSLISGASIPNFQVLANFQERRRKDVSFVDSVILKLAVTSIRLEQGGVASKGGLPLTVTDTSQTIEGVALKKTSAGMTAEMQISNYTTTVFFDGDSASIRFKGHRYWKGSGLSLQGLCYDSSSVSAQYSSSYSGFGCEVQYTEEPDSSIDCTAITARCDLLMQAPFTSCHSHISPDAYKDACKNTLCKYPSKDGLNCQFLEAYARACSPFVSVDAWRTGATCPSSQAFCQDMQCSSHEFCGEREDDNAKSCLCRAIFAEPYRSSDTFGDPTVCGQNSAKFTLIGCLLVEKGLDYSTLHLKDDKCKAVVDSTSHMATFTFDGSNTCGAEVTTNENEMIYKNTIMSPDVSNAVVTRDDQVYINFSCSYNLPDSEFMAFKISESSVVQQMTSGDWHYTLTMKAYTDDQLTQPVNSNTEVHLDQQLWVELSANGLDSNLVSLVTESCWATNQPYASSTPRYDLIKAGCPIDGQNVEVKDNGLGTANSFSFHMFQFSRISGDVYLHCNVNLCVRQNQRCESNCTEKRRRRRSARSRHAGEAPALITLVWTN